MVDTSTVVYFNQGEDLMLGGSGGLSKRIADEFVLRSFAV